MAKTSKTVTFDEQEVYNTMIAAAREKVGKKYVSVEPEVYINRVIVDEDTGDNAWQIDVTFEEDDEA